MAISAMRYLGGFSAYSDANNADFLLAKYKSAGPSLLSISAVPAGAVPGGSAQVSVQALGSLGNPMPDVEISLSADAVEGSGGHNHNSARPAGLLSAEGIPPAQSITVKTGADGKFTAVYTAGLFGGFETVTARAAGLADVSTSTVIEVKFPGLAALSPSALAVKYNLTSNAADHFNTHFGVPSAVNRIAGLSADYYSQTGGNIAGINDMTLEYGGVFDVNSDWMPPHELHKDGKSVDIDRCAVSASQQILVNQKLMDKLMRAAGSVRIAETPQGTLQCAGPAETKRMHYEFTQ